MVVGLEKPLLEVLGPNLGLIAGLDWGCWKLVIVTV